MRWMVLILGLFLSGCYVQHHGRYQPYSPPPLQTTSIAKANAMVGVQQPSAYKVGFMAGCDSGHLSAGNTSYLFKKDTDRFDTDDVYRQGWNDGFNRCVSGEGISASNYYQGNYGYSYYYPDTFYSGFYYPSYYYAPGYSVWLGYYGYPRNRHYTYSHNHYFTPWYGGHKHRGRHFKGYSRGPYIGKHRGGGHGKSYYKGGGNKKNRGGKGRGKKRSGNYWGR